MSWGGRLGYDDAGNSANTQVVLHDYPEFPLIFETRGLPKSKAAQANWGRSMDNFKGSRIGVVVQCENGYVVSTDSYSNVRVYDNDGHELKSFRGGGDHFENFLAAVKSRKSRTRMPTRSPATCPVLCATRAASRIRLGETRTAKEIMETVGERTSTSAMRSIACSNT